MNYPEIGVKAPDFNLHNINNFSTKKASLADFKGKWLVLDFWTMSCSLCIAAFPKINLLQKEFKASIQFILVGNNELKYNKGIEKLYKNLGKVQGLDLAHVYDAAMFERFGVSSTPHVVIIDPEGIVRAITYSYELTKERLVMLLNGKDPGMALKENVAELLLMQKKRIEPFKGLSNKENQEGFAASVFSKWSAHNAFRISTKLKPGIGYRGEGMSISRLYNLAYLGETDWQPGDSLYGRYWHYPVAGLTDIFAHRRQVQRRDLYNYCLVLPGTSFPVTAIKKAMQLDLLKYFGYAIMETESAMPCWFITLANGYAGRLKSKTTGYRRNSSHTGFKLVNAPLSDVIRMLWNSDQLTDPLIDATGIDFNIDLTLVADMTSFESIKNALAAKGIKLTRGTSNMKVLLFKN